MSFGYRGPRPRPWGQFGGPMGPGGPRGPYPGPSPWGGPPRMGFGSFHGAGPYNPMFCEDEEEVPFGGGQVGFGPEGAWGENPDGQQQQPQPLMNAANLTPDEVKVWLGRQNPDVIREINFHTRWLLEKMGMPVEEGNSFAEDEGPGEGGGDMNTWYAPFKKVDGNEQSKNSGPPAAKKTKKSAHPGLGWKKNQMLPSAAPGGQIIGPVQWTPDGWVPKDNSHKLTTMMKPLPKKQLIPPQSTTYPEAGDDRNKLRMLDNNEKMMQAELIKICRRFNIQNLNRDDLSAYPENQQTKLKTAITCVSNAEKTLANYKEFLKTDKYKEWNEEQDKTRDDTVKSMIGDTPEGVPHKRHRDGSDEDEGEEGETS